MTAPPSRPAARRRRGRRWLARRSVGAALLLSIELLESSRNLGEDIVLAVLEGARLEAELRLECLAHALRRRVLAAALSAQDGENVGRCVEAGSDLRTLLGAEEDTDPSGHAL